MSHCGIKFSKPEDSRKKREKRQKYFEERKKKENRSRNKKNHRTGIRNFLTKNSYTDDDLILQSRTKKVEKKLSEEYNWSLEQSDKKFIEQQFKLFFNKDSPEYKRAHDEDGNIDVEFAYSCLYNWRVFNDTYEQFGFSRIEPPIVFICSR